MQINLVNHVWKIWRIQKYKLNSAILSCINRDLQWDSLPLQRLLFLLLLNLLVSLNILSYLTGLQSGRVVVLHYLRFTITFIHIVLWDCLFLEKRWLRGHGNRSLTSQNLSHGYRVALLISLILDTIIMVIVIFDFRSILVPVQHISH